MERGLFTSPNPDSFITEEEIKRRTVFPDKKRRGELYNEVRDYVIRGREIADRFEIGQKEAMWIPQPEYPELPIMILLITDPHFGSIHVDHRLLDEHLEIVDNTPNFYVITNGDDVDNFGVHLKSAVGVYEDPLPPSIQAKAWVERMAELDKKGKLGVIGYGNHNDFTSVTGNDWYDAYLSSFRCPIFTSGGLLHTVVGGYDYQIAMTHKFWGVSKLNPTNVCKRYMEHTYPDADVIFIGHFHQSEGLHFERGGKDRVAVLGGTYKDSDMWARKVGISGRSGSPGWVLCLNPADRGMQLFKDVRMAKKTLEAWI
jgi:hypothetical protein